MTQVTDADREARKAIRRVEQRLERAEAEEPILAAPDGTVAVAIVDLRAFVNGYTNLRDLIALSDRDWAARWYGSEPMKGSHIHTVTEHGSYGEMVAFVGATEDHHAQADKIVMAHNAFLARYRNQSTAALMGEVERLRAVVNEALIKQENDRTLWDAEWQIWAGDARDALSTPSEVREPEAIGGGAEKARANSGHTESELAKGPMIEPIARRIIVQTLRAAAGDNPDCGFIRDAADNVERAEGCEIQSYLVLDAVCAALRLATPQPVSGDAVREALEALKPFAAEAEKDRRAVAMPTEQDAINAMNAAYQRLRELGWNDPTYCPKDGTPFDVIEAGSTGIHRCHYQGEWPTGSWWVEDGGDLWPSRPTMYRVTEAEKTRWAKLRASLPSSAPMPPL